MPIKFLYQLKMSFVIGPLTTTLEGAAGVSGSKATENTVDKVQKRKGSKARGRVVYIVRRGFLSLLFLAAAAILSSM